MSNSTISSITSTSTQSLSDILEAQLRAKHRHQAAEKQSSTVANLDSAESR